MTGRKVELAEVTVPAPLLESSSSQKTVSVTPTPVSEEANDNDHETSDQDTTEPRRSTKVRTCWKYALEAIIKALLLYFLVHGNCLYSCYNCAIRKS